MRNGYTGLPEAETVNLDKKWNGLVITVVGYCTVVTIVAYIFCKIIAGAGQL